MLTLKLPDGSARQVPDGTRPREVAESIAPSLHVYVDHDGSIRDTYEIRCLPQTFIIDREGQIVARSFGVVNWSGKQIEEFLRSLGASQ